LDKLAELLGKKEIEEVLFRYARGVDRRDWDAVRACFYEDAVDWHGEFKGGPEQFIDWVSSRHAAVPFSMHFLGNCLVEFTSPTRAIVETYFIAIQRREASVSVPDGSVNGTDLEVFGRYCDIFENRHGEWRIAARHVAYDSTKNEPSSNHLRKLVGILGRRDRDDPIYNLLNGASN
jgi:hypothetical protein